MAMTDREQGAAIDDLELVAKLLAPGSTHENRAIARLLVKSVTGRMLDSLVTTRAKTASEHATEVYRATGMWPDGSSNPRECHPRRSDPEGVGEAPRELGSGPPPLRSCKP